MRLLLEWVILRGKPLEFMFMMANIVNLMLKFYSVMYGVVYFALKGTSSSEITTNLNIILGIAKVPIFSFLECWTIFLLMEKMYIFGLGCYLKEFLSFNFFFLREDANNTLRILVATDCHLGYMEKDEIRRHDSFQAFEEICSIAEQKQVMVKILYFVLAYLWYLLYALLFIDRWHRYPGLSALNPKIGIFLPLFAYCAC